MAFIAEFYIAVTLPEAGRIFMAFIIKFSIVVISSEVLSIFIAFTINFQLLSHCLRYGGVLWFSS